MDGAKVAGGVFAELQTNVLQVETWTEVRKVVREWATKHWFLPCTTTPVTNGLIIAYHDEARGCQKIQVELPHNSVIRYLVEFEANKGGW